MTDIAIHVDNLSKQYRIGAHQDKRNFREAVTDALISPFRRARNILRGEATGAAELDETIWALKDVSFDIKQGEVVGIIGRNGAGKSTILKVLSRITEPTQGFADVHGRVGSLLEVGTGFHNELTGRENIYLNGAILGMRRSEIERNFDEIVAFSEVEKFIDTPVKHYSSGMYLRLAFAVAAHLQPEILIVDEVLAVGDARFQEKCLNKMQDVSQKGRTVLFVSHNMLAITRLCERAILFDEGRIVQDGPSHQVVRSYMNIGMNTTAERSWPDPKLAPGGKIARLRAVRVRAEGNQITDAVDIRQPFSIEMEYEVVGQNHGMLNNISLFNEEGILLFCSLDSDPNWRGRPRPEGRYLSSAWVPGNFLAEGTLFVRADLVTLEPLEAQCIVPEAVVFQVIDKFEGDSARGDYAGPMEGLVRPLLNWDTKFIMA
jgi:lipopolysaccharide transport system ATP-binding protein